MSPPIRGFGAWAGCPGKRAPSATFWWRSPSCAGLSILTYRHGGFGPVLLGPLCRLLPSPLQSNWRFNLAPTQGQQDAVYFFKTVLSSAPHVLGSRLLADGLPAHLAGTFVHQRDNDTIKTDIAPDGGSAPDLSSTVHVTDAKALPAAFAEHFASWDDTVRYLVEQNRAVAPIHRQGRVIESRIVIPIDVNDALPARAVVESALVAPLIGDAEVFAFVVPTVDFRALGERVVAWERP